jgi:hypothetical protein
MNSTNKWKYIFNKSLEQQSINQVLKDWALQEWRTPQETINAILTMLSEYYPEHLQKFEILLLLK